MTDEKRSPFVALPPDCYKRSRRLRDPVTTKPAIVRSAFPARVRLRLQPVPHSRLEGQITGVFAVQYLQNAKFTVHQLDQCGVYSNRSRVKRNRSSLRFRES